MSSQENGIAGNITPPGSIGITGSTNASPIVINTTTPHGLTTGDKVDVTDHTVNTNANGVWTITRVDATHISLNGSTGNGVGAGTGAVQPLTYGSTFAIPSDGDVDNAASVNVALEALADRSAFVLANLSAYKLSQLFSRVVNDDTYASWESIATNGTLWLPITTVTWGILDILSTDFIDVQFDGTCNVSTSNVSLTLAYANTVPNGTPTFSEVSGSGKQIGSTTTLPVTLAGRISGGQLSTNGTLTFCLGVRPGSGSAITTTMVGSYTIRAWVWRQTGVPQ
jgi:hypothetical protein